MFPVRVKVDDASRVAEIRRFAVACAQEDGLSETKTAEVALVATELATNLVKHAPGGEMLVTRLSRLGPPGVEILSIDSGPGISDLQACLADGFSTAGTPGGGLGAVARLSSEFDVYSQPGKGSVFVSRHYEPQPDESGRDRPKVALGALTVPVRGEVLCGDAWCVRPAQGRLSLLVSDGLGHGPLAAQASAAAVAAFERTEESSPMKIVEVLHRALKGTRGAALAVASIETASGRIRFAGLGNIAGVTFGGTKPQYLLSHNGTAGHNSSRIQEFEYRLPDPGLLILHSDGLTTSWSLDSYPGLQRRHPSVIAGVLYRDASRGRDDVCVVVVGIQAVL